MGKWKDAQQQWKNAAQNAQGAVEQSKERQSALTSERDAATSQLESVTKALETARAELEDLSKSNTSKPAASDPEAQNLRTEVARLKEQNTALQTELASLKEQVAKAVPASSGTADEQAAKSARDFAVSYSWMTGSERLTVARISKHELGKWQAICQDSERSL